MTLASYLQRPGAEKVLLAEIAAGPHYLADAPYITEPGDTPANQPFAPVIAEGGIPRLSRRIQELWGGQAMPRWGELELAERVANGVDLAAADLRGAEVAVRVTGPRASVPYSDAVTVLSGELGPRSGDPDAGIRVEVRDRASDYRDTRVPQARYDASQQADGFPASNDGTPKPELLGKVRNIHPVLIDQANLVYQVRDGSVSSIDAVYDNGISVSYTADTSAGTFTISNAPSGMVTADVTGPHTDTAGILDYLVATYGGAPATDISGLPTGTVGIYIGQPRRLATILSDLMRGVVGWWGFDRSGSLKARTFQPPASGGPVFGETQQIGRVEWEEEAEVLASVPYLYQQNWTRLEAASSVDEDTAAWLRRDGLEAEVTGGSGAKTPDRLRTYFDAQADAEAVAIRARDLFGVTRKRAKLTVPVTDPLLDLGDDIALADTDVDGDYVVVSTTERWDGEIPLADLEAWG